MRRPSREFQPLLRAVWVAALLVAAFACTVQAASAVTEKYTTFKSEKFGFKITYPRSWEFSNVEQKGRFTGGLTPRSTGEPDKVMMIFVMELPFVSNLKGKEIEEYLMKDSDKILSRMGAINTEDDYEVVDKKIINFAGTKAVKMRIEVAPTGDGQAPPKVGQSSSKGGLTPPAQQGLTAQVVMSVKNGSVYGLIYMSRAENFDAGLQKADKVFNSFKFIESPKKASFHLKIKARMYEKTNTLTLTLSNPQSSKTKVYWLAVTLPEDVKVLALRSPKGWTSTMEGSTATFATPDSPMLKGKSAKFSVVTDGPVKNVDWKALDVLGGTVDGAVTSVKLQK